MTGIISLKTTGLILAEPWETDLTAWTSARVGSTTATAVISTEAAHSGSKSVDFQPGIDWPDASYLKLTRTVDLLTGANRKVRFFRGLNVKGAVYDDFLGSVLKSDRWTGAAPVTGGLAKIADAQNYYPINSNSELHAYLGGRTKIAARFKIGAHPATPQWASILNGGSWAGFIFGLSSNPVTQNQAYTHDQYVYFAHPDTALHIYEVQWDEASGGTYQASWALYLDTVLLFSGNTTRAEGGGRKTWFKLGGSQTKGDFYVDWVAISLTAAYKCSLKLGSQTIFDVDPVTEYGGATPVENNFYDEGSGWTTVTETGSQTVEIKVRNASGYKQSFPVHLFFDDLVIMLDTNMTIKGLLGGQKIELWDSGGTLRKTDICPLTGTDVVFTDIDALINTANGLLSYLKVYDTDGTTLLYTSPTVSRWGGDVYDWLPNESNIDITTTQTQVYRTGSGLTPTTAIIAATVTNKETAAKLSGKTIYWTSNLGTCDPVSSETDGDGAATTTFTAGSSAGLGGVRVDFLGDATYGASDAQQLIDIYQAQIVIDATKDFQAFIEGQEIVADTGKYTLGADFKPQNFEVTTPLMDVTLGGWWLIEFYRRGILEFTGRILGAKLQGGATPKITIRGLDDKVTLQRRACNKVYTDEPQIIIPDLLTRYPCGISAGTIALYGNTIKLDATYEQLSDALAQIASETGYVFRLNANRTLDFGAGFGVVRSIEVKIGVNAYLTDRDIDWSGVNSTVIVLGKGTGSTLLVSIINDNAAKLSYGTIEQVFPEKNISTQGTLDLRAQELMNEHKEEKETIAVSFIDTYPTGTYGPHDTIPVTDPDTGLSGLYKVYALTRSLENADLAALVLANAITSFSDALQLVRKDVKDLSI